MNGSKILKIPKKKIVENPQTKFGNNSRNDVVVREKYDYFHLKIVFEEFIRITQLKYIFVAFVGGVGAIVVVVVV